jgi:hypothetical protein
MSYLYLSVLQSVKQTSCVLTKYGSYLCEIGSSFDVTIKMEENPSCKADISQ